VKTLISRVASKSQLVWGVSFVLYGGLAAADVELNVVARVVQLVVRDDVHVAACALRAAGSFLRRGFGGRGARRVGLGGADGVKGRC